MYIYIYIASFLSLYIVINLLLMRVISVALFFSLLYRLSRGRQFIKCRRYFWQPYARALENFLPMTTEMSFFLFDRINVVKTTNHRLIPRCSPSCSSTL